MTSRLSILLLALLGLSACATKHLPPPEPRDRATVDLLRAQPGGEKLYVQVWLPDGDTGIFMVDTGAGISAISASVAERLGIEGRDTGGSLAGLGGQVPLIHGVVPWISIGGVVVDQVDVAIDVPGLPSHAGWLPIDGILGNNVWGSLVIAIDYPADLMELGRPGTLAMPEATSPMFFDGRHLVVPVTIHAGEDADSVTSRALHLELDTGARQIILSGTTGQGFESLATEGVEPIFGIGASEEVPVSAFYRTTRRIPIHAVELGGVRIEEPGRATWMNYDTVSPLGPANLSGLLGFSVLSEHRLVLDFPGHRFALTSSTHDARELNGHQVLLAQDVALHGRHAADRGLFRARMRIAQSDYDGAITEIDAYLSKHGEDTEAQITRARLLRNKGDFETYLAIVSSVAPADLVEKGEMVGAVNTLILLGRSEEAATLAKAGVEAQPESPAAHVALADVALVSRETEIAGSALSRATRLRGNPDAYLVRRSLLAVQEHDPYAAFSHLRQRLQLYPSDGFALWAYGLLVTDNPDFQDTFRADMERAMGRLHPGSRPLDFQAAGLHLLGRGAEAGEAVAKGLERDCAAAEEEASRLNCVAWYHAMANLELERSLGQVQSALEMDPDRSDFLDTLAVLRLANGDMEGALESARRAALLSPDMLYHLWQFERIRNLQAEEPMDSGQSTP